MHASLPCTKADGRSRALWQCRGSFGSVFVHKPDSPGIGPWNSSRFSHRHTGRLPNPAGTVSYGLPAFPCTSTGNSSESHTCSVGQVPTFGRGAYRYPSHWPSPTGHCYRREDIAPLTDCMRQASQIAMWAGRMLPQRHFAVLAGWTETHIPISRKRKKNKKKVRQLHRHVLSETTGHEAEARPGESSSWATTNGRCSRIQKKLGKFSINWPSQPLSGLP